MGALDKQAFGYMCISGRILMNPDSCIFQHIQKAWRSWGSCSLWIAVIFYQAACLTAWFPSQMSYTNEVASSSSLEQFPQSYWEAVSLGYSPQEGLDMYTQLYLKWITNKDLLHSVGNCNNLIGKISWKRTYICIGIAESLCCASETNRTLLINYTPI